MKTVEVMRVEFRKLAARYGVSVKAFSEVCRGLAHEFADGEETKPHHWLMAAEEKVWGEDHWRSVRLKGRRTMFFRFIDVFGSVSGDEMTKEQACEYAQKEATRTGRHVRVDQVDENGFEVEGGYSNHFSP